MKLNNNKKSSEQLKSKVLKRIFDIFRISISIFFIGMLFVYIALFQLAASLNQEIILAGGLLIGGISFVVAIATHGCMAVARFWFFFYEEKPKVNKQSKT